MKAQTIKFNASDYTGQEHTVKINAKGEANFRDYKITFTEIEDDDFDIIKMELDGEHFATASRFKDDSEFFANSPSVLDFSRSDSNAYVACFQLFCNLV